MDPLRLLITILATYRAATDLAGERGPLDLFERWRGIVLGRFGANHWMSEGVTCPICLSFWIAPVVLLLSYLAPPLVWWLAAAGGASFLARRDG
jgi:hypothetical protein